MMSLTCAQIIFFIKIFTFKCWTIVSHENIWNAMTAILAFILIFLSCYGVWLYWKFKEKVCTNWVVISIVTLKCMRKFNASITSKFVWISRFSLYWNDGSLVPYRICLHSLSLLLKLACFFRVYITIFYSNFLSLNSRWSLLGAITRLSIWIVLMFFRGLWSDLANSGANWLCS